VGTQLSLTGMAACDPQLTPRLPKRPITCLSASAWADRLEEEIYRAGRHGTPLSCLLLRLDGFKEIVQIYGKEMSEQAVKHVDWALRNEFRHFDRLGRSGESEFLVLLAGADGLRGEIVARRVLNRLHAIKIEVGALRRPLRISVGIAAWRTGQSGPELVAQTQAAARPLPNGNRDIDSSEVSL
jgi:diguanylate cyclase (GGDEF)-like protein